MEICTFPYKTPPSLVQKCTCVGNKSHRKHSSRTLNPWTLFQKGCHCDTLLCIVASTEWLDETACYSFSSSFPISLLHFDFDFFQSLIATFHDFSQVVWRQDTLPSDLLSLLQQGCVRRNEGIFLSFYTFLFTGIHVRGIWLSWNDSIAFPALRHNTIFMVWKTDDLWKCESYQALEITGAGWSFY